MNVPRLSPRHKAGLAVALALLMWAPQGFSHGEQPVITGHSTFYNGDTFDRCLGSIAGIMRSRVMWFNDQVLVERYGGKGTFVYVTEMGASDPRAEPRLYTEGVFYDFVDPNGAHWHIEEYFYDPDDKFTIVGGVDQSGAVPTPYVERVSLATNRTHVWVVELSARPIFDEFAGDDPHTYYNFLVLVDTCKFHQYLPNVPEEHDQPEELNDKNGHNNGEKPHTHQKWMANLWVGTRPAVVVPYGVSTDGAQWNSEWAYQTAGGEANQASGGASQELTD